MHVDQEAVHPWLTDEKIFLEKSIQKGNKILGLCLGGQLVAQILGAHVGPHPEGWEVGWHPITLHEKPGLVGFEKKTEQYFSQYHRYIFEAPADAEVIASNDWWAPQAFLWKNQILAFQFHPERTMEGNRNTAMGCDLPLLGRTATKEQILALGQLHQPLAELWFEKVLNGFISDKK